MMSALHSMVHGIRSVAALALVHKYSKYEQRKYDRYLSSGSTIPYLPFLPGCNCGVVLDREAKISLPNSTLGPYLQTIDSATQHLIQTTFSFSQNVFVNVPALSFISLPAYHLQHVGLDINWTRDPSHSKLQSTEGDFKFS